MNAREFIDSARRNAGRKKGSTIVNRIDSIYKSMVADGSTSLSRADFIKLLNAVSDEFWEKLYNGNCVAIPYLLNMEIVPNNKRFVNSVNWRRTKQLWLDDEQAFQDRLLVRHGPTRFFLKVKHSTINRNSRKWYYPIMFEIRPIRRRVKDIETKYKLQ